MASPRNSCRPAPQAPSAVEAPTACSTLPLGEASPLGSPRTLCQELDFICLHIWGMHVHTHMCLSRVHACGTHGIYGAQQRELDRTVTWVTGILLGPFLQPQPSQSLFLLAKLARSHQRAISRFIVGQPLGQATYQVSSFSSPL